jgi:exopolyphosphatase/guanosine-5'-triphosphate,3'-diphosphate pyrophosphatase
MGKRYAGIDCGTNSIRLLIATRGEGGTLRDVRREMRVVRLGEGVDATGRLSAGALERTGAALREFAGHMAEAGVKTARMVATSAVRDAANRSEFFAMAREVLGQAVPGMEAEVISGEEEAALSFAGSVGEFPAGEGPFVVTDLGGGSTELVLGERGAPPRAAYSADIGCVRLSERCLPGDPPSREQILAATAFTAQRLAPAFEAVPVREARTWVGVAGTMTTIAALGLGLRESDRDAVHGARLPLPRLRELCERLIAMPRAERARLGPMHPGRADVIGGGAVVALALADELQRRADIAELVVSEHDILDGIVLSVLPE